MDQRLNNPTTTEITNVGEIDKDREEKRTLVRRDFTRQWRNGRALKTRGEALREGGSAVADQFQSQELVDLQGARREAFNLENHSIV